MSDIPSGTVIDGRYRVLDRVGAGGMADVYCAEDENLGRRIAVKLLHRRFSQDREFVERFRREASAAASLQHPNIVGVYDRGGWDGTYYIAMEFCEGETLKDLVRRETPLDPRRAIAITKQILAATRFAHRRGVIHRDLKPQNVILEADEHVKVADFGIARAAGSDITEVGAIMGTAQYLSPEQARGEPVSEASDLYSVGVVLFEMLTGRAPFEADSSVAVALKHVNQPPPSPREFVPEIPRELEAIVLKALAKTPDQRYGDADEMMHDLKAVESHLGSEHDAQSTAIFAPMPLPVPVAASAPAAASTQLQGALPPPAPPPVPPLLVEEAEPPPPERRDPRRALLLAAGLAVLIGLAVLAFLLLQPEQRTVPQVLGQTLDSAQVEIDNKGFGVDVKRRADPAPADTVIDQVPGAGTEADKGSTVTLIVSNGPSTVKVPNVVGLTTRDARRRLQRSRLEDEVTRESSAAVAKGVVFRSDPGEGKVIERGSTVTLFVSTGPQEVLVPNVVGEQEGDAVKALRDQGLSPSVREKSSEEPEGTVVTQSPSAGLRVEAGTSVTIFVSNGKVAAVPDVTGTSQAIAESRLDRAGFNAVVRTRATTDPAEDGIVLAQSPAEGSKRSQGAGVTITVGAVASAGPEGQTP